MNQRGSLGRRFTIALIIYAGLILGVWFVYHNIAYKAISDSAEANAELVSEHLLSQVSAEFERMKNTAAVIAGSTYVQDFLSVDTVSDFYNRAGLVNEIIQKTAYPISLSDSVITIDTQGSFYRFSGGVSNAACELLYDTFQAEGTVYTVIELDSTLYFCHSAPVLTMSEQSPKRVGTVILLTVAERTRKALREKTADSDMVTALIVNETVVLSSDESVEGTEAAALTNMYGMVSFREIQGTKLSVAAAIPKEMLSRESRLFIVAAVMLVALLLTMITILYRYLSKFIIHPMLGIMGGVKTIGAGEASRLTATGEAEFDRLICSINDMLSRNEEYHEDLLRERQKLFDAHLLKQTMQIGLLKSQIDAHFVVNALSSIQALSARGSSEDAARMAEGLAQLLKHQHTGDALVNIFLEYEMIEKYVAMMNIRFDHKFHVEYDIEDGLSACLMPGLILQPIVENALTHGLMNRSDQALLLISGRMDANTVVFELSDNGVGIPPAKLQAIQNELEKPDIGDFPEPGLHGVALINIQRRIRLKFGCAYGLSILSELGKGTTVTLRLPVMTDNL